MDRLKDPKGQLRDASVSWVSIVEKKLGLEMDDDSDDESDESSDIGKATSAKISHFQFELYQEK